MPEESIATYDTGVSAKMTDNFAVEWQGPVATVTLRARIDSSNAQQLADALLGLVGQDISRLVFRADELEYRSSAGLRAVVFAKQKLGQDSRVHLVGASPEIVNIFVVTGFDRFIVIEDTYSG
jgi:anti-anti-sigma factor